MYDALIIGRGPAGISASLYTVRAGLRTLVLGKRDSILGKAGKIENYFGFSSPVSGSYLLEQGESQAERLGVELLEDEVITVEHDGFFKAKTSSSSFESKTMLLATGQPPKKVAIEDLERFEGKGVSYCTTCDGFFYKNLKVGILGHRDFAVHEAMEMLPFTRDIIILTNGREPDLSESYAAEAGRFRLDARKITRFSGSESLDRVVFSDGTHIGLDGVFVAEQSASGSDFARKLGVIFNDAGIVVDAGMKTNVEGLFAAGDCTGLFKQVSVAVGQGAVAGRRIVEYIRKG